MVSKTLLTDLKENFAFTLSLPEILGVMLYGSHILNDTHSRSDVDICIVCKEKPSLSLWNQIMELQSHPKESYSIFFFQELPLYIKKDIFQEGIVILSPDVPELYEFFFPYRKIWHDEAIRIKNC